MGVVSRVGCLKESTKNMNPGGGSKGGYGEPQPAGYGQPITPPPAYGQQAPSYGQQAPSYTYGNPDTMPVSSQPQHTAITVVQAPLFGREPMETFCPRCQRNVRTTTIKKTSQTAYLYAIILCLCCYCLACIPCCMDSCKNVEHSCPSCGAQLGVYKA